jgi:ubiquinol-cytochrome c reductase cytochrome b subunit
VSPNVRRAVDWLEHRTGLETAVRNFFLEDIPASSGWAQVFGSVALFLFLTQVFTGILLAFNYAPTPGYAYNSLRYIVTEVTMGRMIRGLHHWGASMMIVVVVLHMIQVFIYGAYKRPREATWMVGLVLLLIVLGFGLTGYLLPWDNRAYWGTVVTTQIAGQAPGLGQYVQRLMGAEEGVGVVTFARFYALHVLLLPPLTLILVGVHVYLVRRHGVTPAAGDVAPKKKFFPGQVFKDSTAIFIAFIILFTMAAFVQVPLGRLADPTDTTFIPRPDWYFLFLFQTLKAFKGSLEPIGSVVLPTIAIIALFLVPFIDRGRVVAVARRTTAIGVVVLAAVGWTALTTAAVLTTPASKEATPADLALTSDWNQLSPEELAGIGYFRQENCSSCHNLAEGTPKIGPSLATVGTRKSAAWMIAHFKNPKEVVPGSNMPPITLSDSQLNTLAAFLLKVRPDNAESLTSAPDFAVRGSQVYVASGCAGCHSVNGSGSNLGPALNGLARRRDRDWVVKHFGDPKALSPGTTMPPYRFNGRDMAAITNYVMALP